MIIIQSLHVVKYVLRSFANCCKKGKENKMEKETKESIKKEYEALGSMK